jgi:ribosome-associated translation inhibitor RaiA
MTVSINTKGFSKTAAIKNFILDNISQATKGFRTREEDQIKVILESSSKYGKKGDLYTCKVLYGAYSVVISKVHTNMYGAIEIACDLLRRKIGRVNQIKNRS